MDDFQPVTNRFAAIGIPADHITWTGRPASGLKLRRSDVLFIPFSILWGGFAIVWETMAVRGGAPIFMALWGIPFVVIGLYIMIGRFFYDAGIRSNTYYALTKDSAILIPTGIGGSVPSVYLPSVNNMSMEQAADRSGTIYFGSAPSFQQEMGIFGRQYGPTIPAFRYISDVSRVYEKCKAAQRQDTGRVTTPA